MKQMLFTVCGRVIRGTHIGRRLGFPTANLDRKTQCMDKRRLPHGIYGGVVTLPDGKKTYRAGIVIGPLDKKGLPKIEAHLLNFSGNLYGKKLCLTAMRYVRAFKVFKSEEALKKQIAKDLANVRAIITR
ncbi:MAG: hypothetical protein A2W65_01380 [Candidatus Taylorbacteria bacterium RIFCSPLOWO2_02_50_13]|nr:MAG: hypothetical protein A2W65_01380 [Candidatus Taylorbacteria bacterium RIFCSPLOWO2_02_50_13]OHA46875.1 MAG: hypothetical protein A3G61_00860 [Candidatus Taylorbacteria bacterium RIFCSPLOWO2_12_FULL_49_67]